MRIRRIHTYYSAPDMSLDVNVVDTYILTGENAYKLIYDMAFLIFCRHM